MKKKLLVLLCALLLICCTAQADGLNDGVYSAAALGKNADVNVTMTIENGAIASVEIGEHQEDLAICQTALEQIPAEIVAQQSVAVDAVSGCTLTSNAIIEAASACIELAGGDLAAWSQPAEKEGRACAGRRHQCRASAGHGRGIQRFL